MSVFYIKQGDRAPIIQTTLLDPSGTAVDLTAASSVTLKASSRDRAPLLVDDAATISDAVNGVVTYQFTAVQTANYGVYALEWVRDVGLPTEQSYPNVAYDALHIEKGL